MTKHSTLSLLILFCILGIHSAFGQDHIKMMQYNLMYYTENSGVSDCTTSNNNLANKDANIRTIFHHVMPDVFCVCEMGSSLTYVERLLNNAINTDGISYYRHGPLTNYSGGTIANMIYYDSRKLALYDSYAISTSYRDINGYTMYLKSTDLANGDTIFITFWIAHLKAGSSEANANARALQAQRLMEKIESMGAPGNYVVSGDFNLYGASEPAYQEMINYNNSLYRLYDPIDQEGEWNNNRDFKLYHTQSTHAYESTGCFATGGMDDRFDFILVSPYVYYGSRNVQVLPETYYALGQDGQRFNNSINSPANTSVPTEVANALYNQSDHVPVITEFEFNARVGITDPTCELLCRVTNPIQDGLDIQIQTEIDNIYTFDLYSIDGKLLHRESQALDKGVHHIKQNFDYPKGVYILKVSNQEHQQHIIKLVKQ